MIRRFLSEYQALYISYLIIVGMFLLLFQLYQLPIMIIAYAILVTLTLLVIISILLYWRFYRKMRDLKARDFSSVNTPLEQVYLSIIAEEQQAARMAILEYKSREEDMQAIVKMWAHQIKVPIAALSLMSQTDQLAPQEVNLQLQRIDNYLANVLNFIKLNGQVSDFSFEEVDVRSLIAELVKKYKIHFLLEEQSVEIIGNWTVKSDRKWLSFALSQLLDNALKYNRKGGKITITLADGLTIEDEGIGILKEDIPRILDEGFTGFNGREHQKATGFGLYLTKRILTQLEMDIHIESKVQIGTKVTIQSK